MKYEGRITLTLFAFVSIVGYILVVKDEHTLVSLPVAIYLLLICAVAWRIGLQYDRVKYRSYIDQLTQSFNRSFIKGKFAKLSKQALLKSKKLVVYFIDVDHFKGINDRHGHQIGDEILRKISEILLELFADRGYVIRWGGDEFVVVVLADEAQSDVLQKYIHFRLNSTLINFSFPLSVSIGKAVYPDEGFNLSEIVHVADQKMYEKKKSSR